MSLVAEVLRRFDERGVEYCHWKSNDHLDGRADRRHRPRHPRRPGRDRRRLRDLRRARLSAGPRSRTPATTSASRTSSASTARRTAWCTSTCTTGFPAASGTTSDSDCRGSGSCSRPACATRPPGCGSPRRPVEVVLLLTRYALKLRGRDIARGAHGPGGRAGVPHGAAPPTRRCSRRPSGCSARAGRDAIGRVLADGVDVKSLHRLRPRRAPRARVAGELPGPGRVRPPDEPRGRVGAAGHLAQGRAAPGAEGAGRHRRRTARGVRRAATARASRRWSARPARCSLRSSTSTPCTSAPATARRRWCASR